MTVFTSYLVASFIVLFGCALLVISLLRPDAFAGLRSMATDLFSPAGELGAAGRSETRGIFEDLAGYYDAGRRNAELEREVEVARVQKAEMQALAEENRRLKALLELTQSDRNPVATGRLIGSTSSSARRFAYVSAGRDDGVTNGMPVSSPMGLVGRVVEVGSRSARVLLLTDSESMVPVRRSQDNVVAFAEGRADGALRLRLINLGINPIEEGDVFVTSGAGGLFPPGIAVAVATEITRDGAIARVLSNPAATDFVMVEPIWQPDVVNDPLALDQAVSAEAQGEDASREEAIEALEVAED